jgi:hypothetical protein
MRMSFASVDPPKAARTTFFGARSAANARPQKLAAGRGVPRSACSVAVHSCKQKGDPAALGGQNIGVPSSAGYKYPRLRVGHVLLPPRNVGT